MTATDTNKEYGSTQVFAGTEFTVTGTLFNGDTLTNVTLASTGAPDTAPAGSFAITPSAAQGVGLSNYVITYNSGTLTVAPKTATIAANPKSKTYGDANPALDAAVTGTINGDTLNYTLGTTATATSGAGSYPITVILGEQPQLQREQRREHADDRSGGADGDGQRPEQGVWAGAEFWQRERAIYE